MNKLIKSGSIAAIALVIVIVVGSIGFGFAYSAITNSLGNEYGMDYYILATDEYGDKNIQLPSTTYTRSGDLWVAKEVDLTLDGNLKVSCSGDSVKMRVWVEMGNKLTWTAIQSLSLSIDGVSKGTLFDYHTSSPYSESCASVGPFDITKGDHTFQFRVVFRDNLTSDPNPYLGDYIKSKIVFIEGGGTDPIG